MNKIETLLKSIGLEKNIYTEDVPNLDLYMDQVIQLFESTFSDTKKEENEKILTKTMINNYAKARLFFPIKNKKYTKEHILLISLIFQLKGVLAINEIKEVLGRLNEKIVDEQFDLERFYDHYLSLTKNNAEHILKNAKELGRLTEEKAAHLDSEDQDYLSTLLLIAAFAHQSNIYKRAAEKLASWISDKSKDEKGE